MPFQFPASDLDSRAKLLAVLGSFWANIYHGKHPIESMAFGAGQLDKQAHADILDLFSSLSRFKVPVYHYDEWYELRLKESEKNQTVNNLPRFDGTDIFTDITNVFYGVPKASTLFHWPAPEALVNSPVLLNRITDSSLTLLHGIDFVLRDGDMVFRQDPFLNELVAISEITEDNNVVDREASLWLYRSAFDWDTIYRQFGYVVSLRMDSSRPYRDLVNAVYDGLVEGTAKRAIENAFAAMTDTPVAVGGETIETIFTDSTSLWICSDKNAYRYHLNASPLVAVGDALVAGQQLTDTMQFFEFNRAQVPEEVRAVALGKGYLATGYLGDLVFENKEVDLVVETDDDGITKVSFEIGGFPGDVEKFWDDVHAQGVADGTTLANLLDQRTNKTGQPTALALPAKMNPFGFLCQNVFRNNLFLVFLKTWQFGAGAVGLRHAGILRRLVPPHTAFLLVVELQSDMDEILMEDVGDAEQAGYSEDVLVYLGATNAEEIDAEDFIEEEVFAGQLPGHVG